MARNTLFTIFFVLLLITIGYIWYGYWAPGAPQTTAPIQEFSAVLTQLENLQKIDIDTTLFRDPAFTALESPPELPEPAVKPGRPNPFVNFR